MIGNSKAVPMLMNRQHLPQRDASKSSVEKGFYMKYINLLKHNQQIQKWFC